MIAAWLPSRPRGVTADGSCVCVASAMQYINLFVQRDLRSAGVARDAATVASGGQDMRLRGRPKPGSDGNFGRIDAVDLKTGKRIWSRRQRTPIASSLLASAGGLLFGGSRDRYFRAYDSANGKVLWQVILNASPSSSPATYSVDGVQYLVIVAGGGGALDSGSRNLTPEVVDPTGGTTVWVFRVPR